MRIEAVVRAVMRTKLMAAVLGAAGVAAAATVAAQTTQLSPPPTLQRAALAPLLPDGAYLLTLTPAAMGTTPIQSAQPIVVGAQVAHTGSGVTITMSDGTTLSGAASITHIKASGPVHASTMTVEVGGSGTSASGTFLVAGTANHKLSGTASLAPAPRAMARTEKSGGCDGIWDCIKTITGTSWHFFD